MRKRIYEVNEVQNYFKDTIKCKHCEMCFDDICNGKFYGKFLTEKDKDESICEGYDIDFTFYSELEEKMHQYLNNN